MASRRLNPAKPRRDVAAKIAARLATRVDAIKADREAQAASIDAIQAAGNVAQLRTQMVRQQREIHRVRQVVLDIERLQELSLGLDDGTTGDDPNA